MQINWPDNLVEEIAYRRCVLFLGAGISATAKNDQNESPKKWGEFIIEAKSLINPQVNQEKIDFVDKMLSQGNYLLALQTIADYADPGRYGHFLRQSFSRPNFRASTTHSIIKEIDSKIVVTTNFDKIYDNLCNDHGYTIARYDEFQKMLNSIKSTENLIIKAHGTIDDLDSLIFTQRQYYEIKKKHPIFYNILNSLFMTNTIVFLGYSLNDPDINLVLELVANSSSPASPHYVVLKQGIDEEIKRHWRDCYNIYALEFGPMYEDLEQNLLELQDKVASYRNWKGIP